MQRINFFVATIILIFPMTLGAVPQLLSHQGYTANNNGTPLSGSASATFNLYGSETGGESIWTQTMDITFDAGYYSVTLGPGTPELSTTIFDGSELYLGMTLDGQDEFLPRMKIGSMPYAFRAGAVEGEVKAVGGLVVDGVEVINDQQQWLGNDISFGDLADIPEDLADGDDVGLEGSGTDGTLAKFTESGVGDSLIVESDGKIGVGTDDPQSTVQISGGLQIEDDTGDCVEGKAGTLRWHENKVEVCDGSSWGALASSPSGQSEGSPGEACQQIMESGSTTSGLYWIRPGDSDTATQVYCDMETDDGGWTLVMNINTSDGSIVHFANWDFWESPTGLSSYLGNGQPEPTSDVAEALERDFKAVAQGNAFANLPGTKMMVKLHRAETVYGWKSWNLHDDSGYKFGSFWNDTYYWNAVNASARLTNGEIASDTGSVNANEPIVKQTWGDLYANSGHSSTDMNRLSQRNSYTSYPLSDNRGCGLGTYYDTTAGGRPENDAQMCNTSTWSSGIIGTDHLNNSNWNIWGGKSHGGSSTYNWNGLSNVSYDYAFFIK